MGVGDDTQIFTETQADLDQLLPAERRRADQAAALAAERARWQKRVDDLQRTLAERDQLLAERERRIEELQARLATRTLEREGLAAELRESRPLNAAVTDALPPEARAALSTRTAEQSPKSISRSSCRRPSCRRSCRRSRRCRGCAAT